MTQTKPHRGIPQGELDKLQQLKTRLAQLKVTGKYINVYEIKEEDKVKEVDGKVVVSKPQMIDVAANLTNFR